MRVIEDINATLHELMATHAQMHVIGEDLLDPYGGAFKATKGLSTRFPGRVLTTPLCEATIVGFAAGLAMRGIPVMAEIMFGDFATLIFDQLVNHAAKASWMFDGAVEVPMVVRVPMGGGRGYGPTHSQSIEKHFCGWPGLTVLAANIYRSPGALLREAVGLKSPVLFVENKVMYAKAVQLDGLSKSSARPDIGILTYGGTAEICVAAAALLAKNEELDIEVVAIEQLWPFDHDAVLNLARRCSRILVVEESSEGWGFAAECGATIASAGLSGLRFASLTAPNHPIPNSREWELRILPNVAGVHDAALALVRPNNKH
jgi:acetoin:2,6-dichlorophenolindophenol oxidoreductase subunit beta